MKKFQTIKKMSVKYQYIDPSYLQTALHNDKPMIEQLVAIFKEEAVIAVEELNNAIKNQDWATVAKIAHRLKINVKILGMQKLHDELLALEIKAKSQKETETYQATAELFENLTSQAIIELEEFIKTL